MQDPSQGVHRELLAHVHLLSTYRFAVLPHVHHDKIADWLLAAPKIVRDQSPFFWSYLDRPSDGSILLTWQPLDALGTKFATDGYIWPPIETAFQLEIEGGYTLEMYQHKAGYGPNEPVATHARRRYRLMPSKFPNPNMPTPDPALWITHYYQADPADRVPSSIIPVGDVRTQSLMQARMYLQTQGQIVQKEFMLHDRTNWPQIQFPRGQVRQPSYSMMSNRTPQVMAYPPHQMGGASLGPPTKRPRTQNNSAQGPAAVGSIPAVEAPDDEEDTSRGDLFDHMTPREISWSRYSQNHEWMEEILSSPYPIGQITPVDLGLGLKGELHTVTDGIFHASTKVDEPLNGNAGGLDLEKAKQFRKRVTNRIVETKADIEKMRVKHAKRMEKFKKGAMIAQAEKELRGAVDEPADMGTEYWRLEGRIEENLGADDDQKVVLIKHKVDSIVAQVEVSLDKHAVAVQELRRIQDGGLEESPSVPELHISRQPSQAGSQHSGVLIGDGDLDMGGSAAGLLDQFHTGFSSTSTPGNSFSTPQPHLQSNSYNGTPKFAPSPLAISQNDIQQGNLIRQPDQEQDVEMRDTAKEVQVNGDWVVVPAGGVSPPTIDSSRHVALGTTSTQGRTGSDQVGNQDNANNVEDLDLGLGENFNTDANDFGSLEDLDTAGEALDGYGNSDLGETGGELGVDLDLGMDMGLDDSAFGDAFHGVEPREGDVEGDGM